MLSSLRGINDLAEDLSVYLQYFPLSMHYTTSTIQTH